MGDVFIAKDVKITFGRRAAPPGDAEARRLAEIRARADAATPGPWHPEGVPGVAARAAGRPTSLGPPAEPLDRANAAFVAAARDDVPWLLDLVAELRGLLADLCEDSRAAAEAVRYRRALEDVLRRGCTAVATAVGVVDEVHADHIAREALEGKGDG